jgi:hypothetical protein
MKTESRRAFTLIELLVVVSINDTLAFQFGFSGGVLIAAREAVKRGWVCALLPPVSWGRGCLEV